MPRKSSQKKAPKFRRHTLGEPEGINMPLSTSRNNELEILMENNEARRELERAEKALGQGGYELGEPSRLVRQSTGPTGYGPDNRFRHFERRSGAEAMPWDSNPASFHVNRENRLGWGGPRSQGALAMANNRKPRVLTRKEHDEGVFGFEGKPRMPKKQTKKSGIFRQRRNERGEMVGNNSSNMLRVLDDDELFSKLHATLDDYYGLNKEFIPDIGIDPTRALEIVASNLRLYSAKEKYSREQYGRSTHEMLSLKAGLAALRERLVRKEQQLLVHNTRNELDAAQKVNVEIAYLEAQITECLLNIARCDSFEVSVSIPNYVRLDNMLKRIAYLLNIHRLHEDESHDEELAEASKIILIATNILNRGELDINIKRKMMEYISKFKLLHMIYLFLGNEEGWPLGYLNKEPLFAAVRAVLSTVDRGDLYEQSIWATGGFRSNEARLKRITRYIQKATGVLVNTVSRSTTYMKDMAERIQSASLSGLLRSTTRALRSSVSSAYKWSVDNPWMDEGAFERVNPDRFLTLARDSGNAELLQAANGMVLAIEGIRDSQQNSQQSESDDFDVAECDGSILKRATTLEKLKGLLNQKVLPTVPEDGIEYSGYNEPRDLGTLHENAMQTEWEAQQGYSQGQFNPLLSNNEYGTNEYSNSNGNNNLVKMLNEGF